MHTNFKPGDRVRWVDKIFAPGLYGKKGTVTKYIQSLAPRDLNWFVYVRWDKDKMASEGGWCPHQFELLCDDRDPFSKSLNEYIEKELRCSQ